MDKPVVRFAPSPTGRLHIGNARPALLNWLYARKRGGTFILRYDDTDRERSTKEFAEAIAVDLAWLGVKPDRIEHQSARFDAYDAVADRLRAATRLYPCFETEEELDYRRKRQLAMHRPPIYDRAALNLSTADRVKLESEGRKAHWRFRLDHRAVAWDDLVRGPQSIDTASLSDPVLIRADGTYLYTLPSVVDDIDMGVTDVIRGEDHVTNTAVQIELFDALGAVPPRFGHTNLLTLPSGEGLSKRLGHLSLSALREEGYEPSAVAALAVLIGTAHAVEPVANLDALVNMVDLSDVSHSSAKFDPAELAALNARTLHQLPFSAVKDRLAALKISGGEDFWNAVRGNVARLPEAVEWWKVVHGDITPEMTPSDKPVLDAAARLLPPEPWDGETWARWTDAIKMETGAKGKALFRPLRLAITAHEHGPELKALLPLIGRARVAARLNGQGA